MSYSVPIPRPRSIELIRLQDLQNDIPISSVGGAAPQILGNVASITRLEAKMATVSHYDIDPVIDIYGGVDGRDLGGGLTRHFEYH